MSSALVRLEDRIASALVLHELGLAASPRLAGRYAIRAIRGRGARGLVCRAVDERLDREVAPKLYADAPDARIDLEIEREARALARLDHPNVVRVYDVGRGPLELDGSAIEVSYLVMELVDGHSLRADLASPGFAHAARLRVLADVALALEAAHAAGIVHRDVKPENVMIDRHGRVRVVDFGLSREASADPEGEPETTRAPPRATSFGRFAGTIEYMAPEAREGRADARSDQFSFAMMAWECLADVAPFDGRAAEWRTDERFAGHERIDPALRPVLERALARDPADRHPSMEALRAAFVPTRTGPLVVAGLALVLALAATAAAAIGRSAKEPSPPPPHHASDAGAIAAAIDASEPEDCAEAAGRWEIDTLVTGTRVRSVPVGNRGYFAIELDPLGHCDFVVRLTKLGDDTFPSDAGPYYDAVNVRDVETRARLEARADGLWLEQNFGLSSPRRGRRDYHFAMRFTTNAIVGDFRHATATGALAQRGELRGARRRPDGALRPDPASLPCASRCRLDCADDALIVAACVDACAGEAGTPTCADPALSRNAPPPGRLGGEP